MQAKRAKQEQLKKKLDKSLGKFRDAKGEKKTEVLISDLGKDVKLKHCKIWGQSVSDSSLCPQSDFSDFLKFSTKPKSIQVHHLPLLNTQEAVLHPDMTEKL